MKVVEARVRGGKGHGARVLKGPRNTGGRGPNPPDLDELVAAR